jgi:AcrR family transcriptional regulator
MNDRQPAARPAEPGRDDGPGPAPFALPGTIAAAWGLRERPGKGPKRGLSLPQIVSAGLAVAASDGLGAVSMSRVAAELGVGTMSLYRYVESKQELLDLMVDASVGAPPPAPEGARWRDGLAAWARAELAVYRDHLWALQVPLAGPPAYPNSLSWLEQALHYLRATGLDEEQKMAVILLVSNYVRTHATMESQIDAAVRAAGITGEEAMAGYGQLLRALLDPRRFPELAAVAASGVMDKNDPWDENFDFGLDRILDGVDVLVRAAGRQD